MAQRRLQNVLRHLQPENTSALLPLKPLRVAVTGAVGQIGYALLPLLCSGRVFGEKQRIILHLLDLPPTTEAMRGVKMELEDCAFPLLAGIVATHDPKEAFSNVDVAILVGARPRGPGMERKDLLAANASIFQAQGKALNDYAHPNVKVLVVGNPANTNALVASANAPKIPKENFTALTRLDQNRAAAQLALRMNVDADDVKNVIIWGNHSATQVPDVSHAYVKYHDRVAHVKDALRDEDWRSGSFVKTVQTRGAAVIQARKLSSAMSAANAIADHLHSWLVGTPKGEYVSMGVPSDGSYGIQPGLVYSFPVRCVQGTYEIVQGLELDDLARKLKQVTEKELLEERKAALGH